MNSKRARLPAKLSRGITLIEILMVLGLLTILLSFAIPSVSSVANKAEFRSAFENVQYSVQVARKTARMTEKPVSMNISTPGQEATQTITFSSTVKGSATRKLRIQDFSLPADIVLISDHDSFVFDERGLVEKPGRIVLVSTVDETVTSTLEIE